MEEMEILLALHELDLWPIDHEITEREVKEKWKALMVAFHPDKLPLNALWGPASDTLYLLRYS